MSVDLEGVAISLVLDFLAAKDFSAAEAALREQLRDPASRRQANAGTPRHGTRLEQVLRSSATANELPALDTSRQFQDEYDSPTTHATPEPPMTFHKPADDPVEETWSDDDDLGYTRLNASDDALLNSMPWAYPHVPQGDAALPASAASNPASSSAIPAIFASRWEGFETFENPKAPGPECGSSQDDAGDEAPRANATRGAPGRSGTSTAGGTSGSRQTKLAWPSANDTANDECAEGIKAEPLAYTDGGGRGVADAGDEADDEGDEGEENGEKGG
eukprot:CAMPEP_0119311564 /NCGR_PEP_ID=MMETSP1333-20130426/22953_1 /TAXON_ID=418940 /ORGANISM="Scyphosphaera apsteinii, Strain RCC1455" /LENGTH=274 /DNA_ID=CAMNT_0007315975 /DNA_START=79 /DNA_END=899 /DNA_ORIENTATION=-